MKLRAAPRAIEECSYLLASAASMSKPSRFGGVQVIDYGVIPATLTQKPYAVSYYGLKEQGSIEILCP